MARCPLAWLVAWGIAALASACMKSADAPPRAQASAPAVALAEPPSTFEFSARASAQAQRDRLGLDMPWAHFHPTGRYAPARSALQLNVHRLPGTRLPVLLIGTHSRYEAAEEPIEVRLKPGLHAIDSGPHGGLRYIRRGADAPAPCAPVKASFFDGFRRAPRFVRGHTTMPEWRAQRDRYGNVPDVTVVSERTFQVDSLKSAVAWKAQDPPAYLEEVDRIAGIENEPSGLEIDPASVHDRLRHNVLMTETDADVFMAATWYGTVLQDTDHALAFTRRIKMREGGGLA